MIRDSSQVTGVSGPSASLTSTQLLYNMLFCCRASSCFSNVRPPPVSLIYGIWHSPFCNYTCKSDMRTGWQYCSCCPYLSTAGLRQKPSERGVQLWFNSNECGLNTQSNPSHLGCSVFIVCHVFLHTFFTPFWESWHRQYPSYNYCRPEKSTF